MDQDEATCVLLAVEDELARCRDLASRARAMARHTRDEWTRTTLNSIALDYERLAAVVEAQAKGKNDQEE